MKRTTKLLFIAWLMGPMISLAQVAPTGSTSPAAGAPLLTIKAVPITHTDKSVRKRQPVEVSGTIEFRNDANGGDFYFNGERQENYALGHALDIDEATRSQLGKLADSKTRVIAKGTLKIWKDGSAAFDTSEAIHIFK
jgi:hypothetical protein